MDDGPQWFAPKRFGYGAGLPIAWQGWLLLTAYLVIALVGALLLAPRNIVAFLALFIPLTAVFVLIASKTTRGGWRWRPGKGD